MPFGFHAQLPYDHYGAYILGAYQDQCRGLKVIPKCS